MIVFIHYHIYQIFLLSYMKKKILEAEKKITHSTVNS